jgi:acetyl-CoA C-acetyltransferase
VDLAVWAGRPLLLRQPFPPEAVDEVVLGCVNPHYDEVNPGRVAAMRLGCGTATPGWTVQRNCGSGMQSVDSACQLIAAGRADIVLAGGTEALSHTPVVLPPETVDWLGQWRQAAALERARLLTELRPDYAAPVVTLLRGLTDPNCGLNMGQTAEVLAYRFGISREAADRYALESHKRLAGARESGALDEIVPMYAPGARGNGSEGDGSGGDGAFYDRDDGARPDSTLDDLGRLPPVFEPPHGNVTAGNSAQVTDGAAWLLLASGPACERWSVEPIGHIVDTQWAALPPDVMGLGPVFAATPLLQRAGLRAHDVDLWELNEAFAAQVLACLAAWEDAAFCRRHLGLPAALGRIDHQRLNVDGGAIALGHPVGTSGTRVVLHLLKALGRRGGRRGIATECIGGGMGGAMLVEAA